MEEKKHNSLEIMALWHYLFFKHVAQKKNEKATEEFWNLISLEITFCCFQSQQILDFKWYIPKGSLSCDGNSRSLETDASSTRNFDNCVPRYVTCTNKSKWITGFF